MEGNDKGRITKGGKRPGSGRKLKYGTATGIVSIRVPERVKLYLMNTEWDWRSDFCKLIDEHIEGE